MPGTIRRLSTFAATALIVSLAFGAGLSSAAPAAHKLTREQIAEKLLARQNGRLFTSSARLGLEAIGVLRQPEGGSHAVEHRRARRELGVRSGELLVGGQLVGRGLRQRADEDFRLRRVHLRKEL